MIITKGIIQTYLYATKEVIEDQVKSSGFNVIKFFTGKCNDLQTKAEEGFLAKKKLEEIGSYIPTEGERTNDHLQAFRMVLQDLLEIKNDQIIMSKESARLFWKICNRQGFSCKFNLNTDLNGTTTKIIDKNDNEYGIMIFYLHGDIVVKTLGW